MVSMQFIAIFKACAVVRFKYTTVMSQKILGCACKIAQFQIKQEKSLIKEVIAYIKIFVLCESLGHVMEFWLI